jgi:hypothetical protein
MIRHGRNVRYDNPRRRRTNRPATVAIATHSTADSPIFTSVAMLMSRVVKVENTNDGVAISNTRELIVFDSTYKLDLPKKYPIIVIRKIGDTTVNI